MTYEEIENIFEETDSEWEGDNAFQGLTILSKYTKELITGAEHDIIYSIDIDDAIDLGITEEDVKQLALLNWIIDEDTMSFACFV